MKHTDAIMSEPLGNRFFLPTWLFCCAEVVTTHLTFILSQEDANARSGANVLVSLVSF